MTDTEAGAPASNDATALGPRFAEALGAKDAAALLEVLHPEVDFRALTPGKHWESSSAQEVVDEICLGPWFGPDEHIESLDGVVSDEVEGRHKVSYRYRVRSGGSPFLVDQVAYYDERDGRIGLLRIICSGYRRVRNP